MAKNKGRRARHVKSVNLALQGGGAHGAFTWGVLDRMFEEDRLWIEAISGTSAGAMNAVVATQGMYDNGAKGAREALADFWSEVSKASAGSPLKRTPFAMLTGNWSLDNSPLFLMFDFMSRIASPYELNPLDLNPLRDLVGKFLDFDKVAGEQDMGVFISATNVETGRVKVFHRHEITLDVVMASACLPFVYKAVEIDGTPYWDGGYMGNPALFPLIDHSPCTDIMIVQINPEFRAGAPRTAREILNRVNEITFNGSLQRDLRMIHFVDEQLQNGRLPREEFREIFVHIVGGGEEMLALNASSKMNAEWAFLTHLFEIGRAAADRWIDAHFDALGTKSTVDLGAMFDETMGPAAR